MTTRQQRHPLVDRIEHSLGLVRGVRYDVGVIRISSKGDLVNLAHQQQTSIAMYAGDPDFQALAGLNPDIKRRGWMQVRYSDLHPEASRGILGWVGLVGRTVFVAVADSASKQNMPGAPSDPARVGRNAFVDLLVAAAIAAHAARIRITDLNRIWRNDHTGTGLLEAINHALPGCELWQGTRRIATQGTERLVTTFEGHQSSAYVHKFQEQTYEKRHTHLSAGGQWDRAERELPLGLRRQRQTAPDGTVTKSMTVEMRSDMWAVAEWALKARATGASWKQIGTEFAKRSVPMPGAKGGGRTFTGYRTSADRAAAARRLITNHLHFYRHGWWTERRNTSLTYDEIRGIELHVDPDTGQRYSLVEVRNMPWTEILTDAQWESFDRLEAAYEVEQARLNGQAVACRSGDASALRGVPTWEADGLEHGFFPGSVTAYMWKAREPQDEWWSLQTGTTVATLQQPLVHRALGNALIAALMTIDAPLAPVIPHESAAADGLADEIAAVTASLDAARRASERADDEVLLADGDAEETDHWRSRGREARARIKDLTAKLDRLEQRMADAGGVNVLETVEADITEPLLVASLLRDGTAKVDPLVASLVQDYGITSSLRAAWHTSDPGVVHLTATARIPLADGTHYDVPLAFDVVDSKDKPGEAALVTHAIRGWARGASFDDIADSYPHWDHERARKAIRNALIKFNVRRPLAASVLDTPSTALRAVLGAHCLDDPSIAAHLDAHYCEQVADAYLVSGTNPAITHWAETENLAGIRRALAVLAEADTWLTIEDLAIRAEVTEALVAIMRASKVIENEPAVLTNRVRARSCGHGCATTLATYLPTPETGSGLLCTTCRRAGDPTHTAELPDEYFDLATGAIPDDDTSDGDLITSSEAAHHLRISHRGFNTLVGRGAVLPAKRVGRRAARFRLEDLDALPAESIARWQQRYGDEVADGLLGTTEAARVLGVTDATLSKLARAGKIPVAAMKGNRRRYARADIETHRARGDQP